MTDSAPFDRRDLEFLLYAVQDANGLCRYPRYAQHSRDTFDAVMDAAGALALAKFATHNRASDLKEPHI